MANDPASATGHIRLTSHPGQGTVGAPPLQWGAADALLRGPVVGTTAQRSQRNVIGTDSGSYGVYRALAVAAGNLTRGHHADLTDTAPTDPAGPYPQWGDAHKIVSIDLWGASVQPVYADCLAQGCDVRPTIDGRILLVDASAAHAPKRVNVSEADLRRALFEEAGAKYPERVTRGDVEVILPPLGGQTLDLLGDVRAMANPNVELTEQVQDEYNGADFFGPDIRTCRPHLTHAITRSLGGRRASAATREKPAPSGITACAQGASPGLVGATQRYSVFARFASTPSAAQAPSCGIEVAQRVKLTDTLKPTDVKVEMEAKIAAGHFADGEVTGDAQLADVLVRDLGEAVRESPIE